MCKSQVTEVSALGNACRLKCTEIVNAASGGNPNTIGAKTIVSKFLPAKLGDEWFSVICDRSISCS